MITEIFFLKECRDVIYYYEFGPDNFNELKNTVIDYTMVKTVKANKSYFIKEDIKGVDRERETRQVIGWPSNTTLKNHKKISHTQQ